MAFAFDLKGLHDGAKVRDMVNDARLALQKGPLSGHFYVTVMIYGTNQNGVGHGTTPSLVDKSDITPEMTMALLTQAWQTWDGASTVHAETWMSVHVQVYNGPRVANMRMREFFAGKFEQV